MSIEQAVSLVSEQQCLPFREKLAVAHEQISADVNAEAPGRLLSKLTGTAGPATQPLFNSASACHTLLHAQGRHVLADPQWYA